VDSYEPRPLTEKWFGKIKTWTAEIMSDDTPGSCWEATGQILADLCAEVERLQAKIRLMENNND